MKSTEADVAFRDLLRARRLDLEESTPAAGFEALIAFYRDERATDVELAEDGDMMILQWGTHDWGEGEHFELDMTRQLIRGAGGDDDIWQLSLTYLYEPDDELTELGSGSSDWCCHPDALEDLLEALEESEPYQHLSDVPPAEVRLRLEVVG